MLASSSTAEAPVTSTTRELTSRRDLSSLSMVLELHGPRTPKPAPVADADRNNSIKSLPVDIVFPTHTAYSSSKGSKEDGMGFDQYHEPAQELARLLASLTEEAEAISWYEQRISVEPDPEARAIMQNALKEEFKHFGMDLEFLLRRRSQWREILRGILFTDGPIVEEGKEAEEQA
jgi:uncharacterized protein